MEAFLRPYWQSPELSFSSGGAMRTGWEMTRQRFQERYPDAASLSLALEEYLTSEPRRRGSAGSARVSTRPDLR